jgi:hypothetical protein
MVTLLWITTKAHQKKAEGMELCKVRYLLTVLN